MIVQLSAGAVALTIFGFCLSRLAGGIIGEYGKRFWFRYIEPVVSKWVARWKLVWIRSLASKGKLQQDLVAAQAELATLRELSARLWSELDSAQLEIIRLKVTRRS